MIDGLTYGLIWLSLNVQNALSFTTLFGAPCPSGNFLGLPAWHKYLDGRGSGVNCVPNFTGLNDIWLIVLAIIEILIRLAAIAAVIFVVIGGIKFVTSRGNPEKTAAARTAVQDALIGVLIAVAAIAVVNFVGRSIN